jgi:hypothetical protein
VHVSPRRLPPPLREHALPLDLRRQRRAPPGGRALPVLVSRDGRHGDAVPHARRIGVRDPAGGGVGSHLRHPRLLLRLVPAQPGAPAVAAASCSTTSYPT